MQRLGIKHCIGYTLSALCGLLLAFSAGHLLVFAIKAGGAGAGCPWPSVAGIPRNADELARVRAAYETRLRISGTSAGLSAVEGAGRTFWVGGEPDASAGQLASELSRIELISAPRVTTGDVIIDMSPGAGVFSAMALDRGAAKVALLETDQLRRAALQRTFAAEIANLRVALPTADRIDEAVRELGLARVDLVRTDADARLAGARETLQIWHPRVLIDGQPASAAALLAAGYRVECLACGVARRGGGYRIEPAALHFR